MHRSKNHNLDGALKYVKLFSSTLPRLNKTIIKLQRFAISISSVFTNTGRKGPESQSVGPLVEVGPPCLMIAQQGRFVPPFSTEDGKNPASEAS